MKLSIRRNSFETNSSSTHSLTICTEEEYEKWKKGFLKFDLYNEKFIDSTPLQYTDELMRKAEMLYNETRNEYYKYWKDLTQEEKEKYCCQWVIQPEEEDFDIKSWKDYEEYANSDSLESYANHFTTPSGDKMVAFGYYGYDG